VVDCVEVQSITTYTASLLCALCFALKQTDLQNLEDDIDNTSCVGTSNDYALPRRNRKTERRVMKQKLKTHKAMAKRVKITGSGKIMRRKVASSHLRRNKSPHSVRSMDKEFQLAAGDSRRMKRLLPYSF
jgi:large subunit ribosomal protein L35